MMSPSQVRGRLVQSGLPGKGTQMRTPLGDPRRSAILNREAVPDTGTLTGFRGCGRRTSILVNLACGFVRYL